MHEITPEIPVIVRQKHPKERANLLAFKLGRLGLRRPSPLVVPHLGSVLHKIQAASHWQRLCSRYTRGVDPRQYFAPVLLSSLHYADNQSLVCSRFSSRLLLDWRRCDMLYA